MSRPQITTQCVLIIGVVIFLAMVTSECNVTQYTVLSARGRSTCLDCPVCQKGFEPAPDCGSEISSNTVIECKPCIPGKTYSPNIDRGPCITCSQCSEDSSVVVGKRCTVTSNTDCKELCYYPTMYYESTTRDCKPCSWCCGNSMDEVMEECTNKGMPLDQSCRSVQEQKCEPSITAAASIAPVAAPSAHATPSSAHTVLSSASVVLHVPVKSTNKPVLAISSEKKPGTSKWWIALIIAAFLMLGPTIGVLVHRIITGNWCVTSWPVSKLCICDNLNSSERGDSVEMLDLRSDESRKLADLDSSYEIYTEVCQRLNIKYIGHGNYYQVAHSYGVEDHTIRSCFQGTDGGPSAALFEYLKADQPELTVKEFITVLKKNKVHKAIISKLEAFDRC